MQGDQRRHDGVENALGHFVAVGVEHRRVGHQVTHVAHEQQRASRQGQLGTIRRDVVAIRIQATGEGTAALGHLGGEVTLHQTQPAGIDAHLVLGIHRRHGVFAVHDGGQRGFHHHVLDVGRVGLADGVAVIDLDFQMQAMVGQQHGTRRGGVALVAHQLARLLQAGLAAAVQRHHQVAIAQEVLDRVTVGAGRQRCRLVQHIAGVSHDLLAALGVEARALLAAILFADHVGAVQSVVEATPTRVGGVQRVACVVHRHHQLGARLGSDLAIHVFGGHLDLGRRIDQIADFLEEGLVSGHVIDRPRVLTVPGREFLLQRVALGQQGLVGRRQVVEDGIDALPEGIGIDPRARQRLFGDELVQLGGHLQAMARNALRHWV